MHGEIGAAVNASPQAVKALRAIGVGDEVAAVGHRSLGIYTRNMQTGEFLEFNDRLKAGEKYGAPYYTFHRADLLDSLRAQVEAWQITLQVAATYPATQAAEALVCCPAERGFTPASIPWISPARPICSFLI